MPRTWRELGSPHLRQLDLDDVLSRVRRRRDPLAGAGRGHVKAGGDDRSTSGSTSSSAGRASPAAGASTRRTDEAMLATLGERGDIVGRGEPEDWAFEMKWDGIRTLARVEQQGGRSAVVLRSRNGKDQGPGYPEIVEGLGRAVRGDAVLDGEIVALDTEGRPSFARLQQRMNLADPRGIGQAAERVPAQVFLFDLLEQDGEPLVDGPYTERRERLEALVTENAAVKVPPAFDGDFDAAWESSERLGLEGVMAKRRDSPYVAGRRSWTWIKVKHARTQEVVVAGWRPGNGRRAGTVGSLLLGVGDDEGRLRYAGWVGTGFSDLDLTELHDRVGRIERKTSPLDDVPRADARDARWVTPRLVGEVEFAEWTDDGRLRQPRWRGWREDKDPSRVRRE